MVKFLLATYGLQVNVFVHYGRGGGLLFVAASKGISEMVSLLLAHGADPNQFACQRGIAPLTEAVIRGHGDAVELLVHGTTNLHRTRALTCAVEQKNKRLAEILLRNGAPPQFCTSEIPTYFRNEPYEWVQPLLLAARSGHLELAELLCEYGADVNVQCSEYLGKAHCLGASIKAIPFDRVLFWVVEEPNEKMVDLLLERGADPNVGDSRDRPPLMYAMDNGSEAIVRSLLDHGADMRRTVDHCGRKKVSPREQREAESAELQAMFAGWSYGNRNADGSPD